MKPIKNDQINFSMPRSALVLKLIEFTMKYAENYFEYFPNSWCIYDTQIDVKSMLSICNLIKNQQKFFLNFNISYKSGTLIISLAFFLYTNPIGFVYLIGFPVCRGVYKNFNIDFWTSLKTRWFAFSSLKFPLPVYK